ncbi:Protein of unknown function [Cotesia congregata]|uniref:USP domain-containing protein n=1 Tax=Cotesia congregata TaxID=51543 RepID=A0A8J2MGB2_COTCN|nr:Protein of unknown function [Cotesia congregata]
MRYRSKIVSGSTADTYERRLNILYPIYKNTEIKQKKIEKENHIALPISRTIICQDNVSSLWTRLFTNEPSIFEKNSCPTRNCKGNNIINITNFPINYATVIKYGFSSLQKAVEFDSVIYNMPCKYCHGKKRTRRQKPNVYIYIELDVKTPEETMGRKCKLRDLQTYLTLPVIDEDDNVHHFRYRLSGVAGYTNNHYIAYCRRLSGAWISYDDTTKKPNSEVSSCEVLPHGKFKD